MTRGDDAGPCDGVPAAIATVGPPDAPPAALPIPCANTHELQSTAPVRYPNRWRKGHSGNPNGRPLGSRHRATILAEALLEGQTEALVQRTIELALAGDPTALRLCIERIISPRRDRLVSFRLPALDCAGDALAAIEAITDGVATGELTPAEAAELAKVVEAYRSAVETVEIERRLSALEQPQGQ